MEFFQPLDIHHDFPPKVAFNFKISFYIFLDPIQLVRVEFRGAFVRVNLRHFYDFLRGRQTDAINIWKRILNFFIVRNIDAYNTHTL